MVMVVELVLVTHHLAVELVHQLVDGRVEVFVGVLHEDVLPLHMQGDFSLLPAFLLLQFLH
jgi:hypothetical protein